MPKNPPLSAAKKPKRPRRRPSNAIDRSPWRGWVRFRQLPFGETKARDLIARGILISALIQEPGAKRGVRLIETASLDRYLRSLAEAQAEKEIA